MLTLNSIPQRGTRPADTDEHLIHTPDTYRMPWSTLRNAFISQETAPASTTSAGRAMSLGANSEFLFFRNETQWFRIPYDTGSWSDTYVRLLRPVFPSLADEPVGAPNGHAFYDTAVGAMKFKQNGSYTQIPVDRGFYEITDGVTTVEADAAGLFKFRSSDESLLITATADDVTHGDNINLRINAAAINVGAFVDDDTYALAAHDHTGVYSPVAHDHTGVYSPVAHDHTGVYSPVAHTHTGVYAPVAHTQGADTITSGTLDDARISQSSVTQHQAALDHDALTNFVGNEHIDHTSVTFAAGTGLSGGGTIAASRTFSLDIPSLTALVSVDIAADYLSIYDADAATHKKVLVTNLGFAAAAHNQAASTITSGTLAAERGGLGANAAAFSGLIKMDAGAASVATAGVDYAAGSHTHSAGAITSGTLAAARGGLGADAASFAGLLKMSSGVASQAVAGTDYAAVSHTHTASTITDFDAAVAANASVAANTAARHTQGTDTGTTSSYFQLDNDASGGRVTWSSGEFQLRNADGSAYADLRVNRLYVEGDTVQIDSNTVNIGDAQITLNADLASNASNSAGGIAVKLLDTDDTTERNAEFNYNPTTRRWEQKGFVAVTSAPVTRTAAAVHSQLIGDGVAQNYVVNHKLNTSSVTVSVVVVSTGYAVLVDWKVVDADNIQIEFGASSIPATDSRRVTVCG